MSNTVKRIINNIIDAENNEFTDLTADIYVKYSKTYIVGAKKDTYEKIKTSKDGIITHAKRITKKEFLKRHKNKAKAYTVENPNYTMLFFYKYL